MSAFVSGRVGYKRLGALAALLAGVYLAWGVRVRAHDADQSKSWERLTQDYASAAVDLAETRLASAKSINKSVQRSIAADRIGDMTRLVEAAQARQRMLTRGDAGDTCITLVAAAEISLQRDESTYAGFQKAVERGGVLSAGTLDLAKTRVQLAKARVALSKALADQPVEIRRQWQIELIVDEMESIRVVVDKLETAQ
jgi:hypothetical protein